MVKGPMGWSFRVFIIQKSKEASKKVECQKKEEKAGRKIELSIAAQENKERKKYAFAHPKSS